MIKKYVLSAVTIDESAKGDFKKLIGWSEKEFRENTREMYEEDKKTLSDKRKILSDLYGGTPDIYREQDVKDSVKEFIKYVTEGIGLSLANDREAKAREIFGERLTK